MKKVVIGVLAGAAFGTAVAVAPAAREAPHSRSLLVTVNVSATEFKYVLSKKSAGRGLVIFKVKNTGKLKHDFQINARKTKLLSPGQADTLRVTFLRKGTYPYKCTVPGHAAAGMKGVFTIT
jgi:uncharacterized cupredoxin-like copper-binding protein